MDGGAWWAAVHGVVENRTRLNHFTFTFHFRALEKEMATHSSVLAQRIPGMGQPGGLPSVGSHRVGHDWSNLAAATNSLLFGGSDKETEVWWYCYDLLMQITHVKSTSTTWQRNSDLVGVASRNRTNSFRDMGEWSSGGCEFLKTYWQISGEF